MISLLGLEAGEVTLGLSSQVVMRGITTCGITRRRQFETWDQTSAYLTSGRVDVGPILTHGSRLGTSSTPARGAA